MKKILLVNGSPKGKSSNTRKLTFAFLKGLNKNSEYSIDELICAQSNIKDCRGCFYCWRNEEGKCSINDEMNLFFKKYLEADIVIWSFPNYFYGMPSNIKKFMDRLLPLYYQNLATSDGKTTYHLRRFDLKNQKYILFCSCGLYNIRDNTEAIRKQFELLYGNSCEMLFCSESQLLSNSFMEYCTNEHLLALEEEGTHFAKHFKFSPEIKNIFEKPFLPIQEFLSFVDASSVLKTGNMSEEEYIYEKIHSFFKNMTLTYDASKLMVENSVLEIQITDFLYVCQLHLDRRKCVLLENRDEFSQYRLKVIANLSFFASNPTLADSTSPKTKGPDFNTFIDLINKFEKTGLTKELRFC